MKWFALAVGIAWVALNVLELVKLFNSQRRFNEASRNSELALKGMSRDKTEAQFDFYWDQSQAALGEMRKIIDE